MKKPERRWGEIVTQDRIWRRRVLLVPPCLSLMKMRAGGGGELSKERTEQKLQRKVYTKNSELAKQLLLPPAPNSSNIYAVSIAARQNLETDQENSDIKRL